MTSTFSFYQLLFAAICLIYIVHRLQKYLRKEQTQSLFKLGTIVGVWLFLLIVVLFPEWVNSVLRKIGLGGDFNTIVLIGFVIVLLLIFKLLSIIEKIERQITEIVRKDALKELER